MWVGGQRHASVALPPGKTRYTLYRRLGGPWGWPGRLRNISSPPAFDPRTFQPIASRYTDCAIPAVCVEKIEQTYLSSLLVHIALAFALADMSCFV